jgi:hypothetical protein
MIPPEIFPKIFFPDFNQGKIGAAPLVMGPNPKNSKGKIFADPPL